MGILSVFAQLEREQIKERTMVGKDSRAKAGLWHGSGVIPTGYDYINGKLVINEYEAMQIREAADLFLSGTPVRTIARMLNAKGYKRKGFDWEAKNVRYALTNPIVIGKLRHRDKVYKGQHEPILDEVTFEKIVKMNDERKEQWGVVRRAGFKSLLGGVVFCKHCGGRYARQANGKGTYYYSCYSRCKSMPRMVKDPNCKNKNYRADVLDTAILEEIGKLALDPEYMKELQDNKPVNDAAEKVKILSAEVEKIDSQISKMMDLYALGSIDLDTINDKVSNLNTTKEGLKKEISGLQASTEGESLTAEQVKTIAELLTDDIDLQQKRNLVQALIHYIEIDNEDVLIHWKF